MEQNNFWNTCERELDRLPTTLCDRSSCSWYINSKKDNYCFWKYVKRNSKVDGSMESLSDDNISKLLNIPKSELKSEIKKATDNFHKILKNLGFEAELINSDDVVQTNTPPNLTIINDN